MIFVSTVKKTKGQDSSKLSIANAKNVNIVRNTSTHKIMNKGIASASKIFNLAPMYTKQIKNNSLVHIADTSRSRMDLIEENTVNVNNVPTAKII